MTKPNTDSKMPTNDIVDQLRALFTAGWMAGDYDNSDHDCRMFEPTAERAWEDFQRSKLGKAMLGSLIGSLPQIPGSETK